MASLLGAGEARGAATGNDFWFTHFRSAPEGLPHQQVEGMTFDPMGRLWIGTRYGLSVYDGYRFKTYLHDGGDSTSLPHNFVHRLFVDRDSTLWIVTDRGLCRYDGATDRFRRTNIDRNISTLLQNSNGDIIALGADIWRLKEGRASGSDHFEKLPSQHGGFKIGGAIGPDGTVYVASNDAILSFDADFSTNGTMMDASIYTPFLTGNDGIVPMMFDRSGALWIGRNGQGVMRMEPKTGRTTAIYDATMLPDGVVRSITEDAQGNIWLGTEGGIAMINPRTNTIVPIRPELGSTEGLNDNAVYCIVPDRAGNLWIGTYFGGINVLHGSQSSGISWVTAGKKAGQLPGKVVRRIIEPEEGRMWIASEDGGVSTLDLGSGSVKPFTAIPQLGNNVHELYYDAGRQRMWLGTFLHGLFSYDMGSGKSHRYTRGDGTGLTSNAIFALAPDGGDGSLWVGTTLGLNHYDARTGQFTVISHPVLDNAFVYSLLPDGDGNLWVGTSGYGLFRIDGRTHTVNNWVSGAPNSDGLDDNYITSLAQDRRGIIYFGTNTGGLYRLDTREGKKGIPERIDSAHDPWGTICNLLVRPSGEGKEGEVMWVSTAKGLRRLDLESLHDDHFTTVDGLRENQFNFSSGLAASDGNLYFGTINGLARIEGGDLRKEARSEWPVHLWDLTIGSTTATPGGEGSPLPAVLDRLSELRLDYGQSRAFSIGYGVVNPAGTDHVRYQLKVAGIDKEWRDIGDQRRFTALDLGPGTYKLMIRAAAPTGGTKAAWEEAPVRTLTIHIAPPWYLSLWAWIVYGLLVLTAIWLAFWLLRERTRRQETEKIAALERQKKDELTREKMELFTSISHDLKTPLSLILAPIKYVCQHEKLSQGARERLDIAVSNTNKMVGLIDELVAYNRVETGNFQLYLQQGNPLTFIQTIAGYFAEAAHEKGLTLKVQAENNGEEVWFSTSYLERILNNLLSNAVKYTPTGGEISVSASIREKGEGKIFLHVEVADTGIGIDPRERDNIFQKYYQTKRGYNTNHQGWGIGLATVKRLAQLHGGDVTVQSKLNRGSTFSVDLDVSPGAFDASHRIDATAAAPEPSYRRMVALTDTTLSPSAREVKDDNRLTLLIVEDNEQLLEYLRDSFSETYKVLTATDGVEAMEELGKHTDEIRCIVSDVMMPRMDGLELCAKVKADINTSHIPVILLTAKTDEASVIRGYQNGAEAYVAKPFDTDILALRIKNILAARMQMVQNLIGVGGESGVTENVGGEEVASENVAAGREGGVPPEEAPCLNQFDQNFLVRINEFIDANIDNSDLAVADITRALGVSRTLLHVKMKNLTGMSTTDYLRARRMAVARELLRQGFNVSETAYRAGFADPSYFAKVFKRATGTSPSEWKG